mmetsp:Transcript_27963/g.66390  ORF Transcript_27963/g.66390 Transcript_27963/m.66390 type:complete len:354 (+) Transcript_27963:1018-2079(+)
MGPPSQGPHLGALLRDQLPNLRMVHLGHEAGGLFLQPLTVFAQIARLELEGQLRPLVLHPAQLLLDQHLSGRRLRDRLDFGEVGHEGIPLVHDGQADLLHLIRLDVLINGLADEGPMPLSQARVPQGHDDRQQHSQLCELQRQGVEHLSRPRLRCKHLLEAAHRLGAGLKLLLHGVGVDFGELAEKDLILPLDPLMGEVPKLQQRRNLLGRGRQAWKLRQRHLHHLLVHVLLLHLLLDFGDTLLQLVHLVVVKLGLVERHLASVLLQHQPALFHLCQEDLGLFRDFHVELTPKVLAEDVAPLLRTVPEVWHRVDALIPSLDESPRHLMEAALQDLEHLTDRGQHWGDLHQEGI